MIDSSSIRRAALRLAIVAALLAVSIGCSTSEDTLAEIEEAQANRQFAETIAPLRAMLDEDPSQPRVNFLLGRALMRTGDSSSAIWPLRRAMEDPEYIVEAGLMVGRAELSSRTPRDVLEAADLVLAVEPDNVEALTIRAQGFLKGGLEERALADLDRGLELEPENLEALVPRVIALIGLERIEEAEQALARAKEVIETTDQTVREQLRGRLCIANALFAFEKGETERATGLYDECLEVYPTNQVVVSQAVAYFDRLKERDRATEILRKAHEASDTPYFGSALARRMGKLGDQEEREKLLREATEEKGSARAWFALADFYVLQERYDEACEAFEKSIAAEEDPSPMRLFAYIDTLIQAERYEDARRETQRIKQEHMRNLLEGRLLLVTGDPEGALRKLEAGLRLWPDNSTARFLAGQAAEQLGDFDRAIEEYREAIRQRKGTGETEAAFYLARVLFDRGSPREAYPSLHRFIATNKRHKEALVLLVRVGRALKTAKLVATGMTGLMSAGRPDLAMAHQIEILAADSGPEAAIVAADKSRLDLNDPENSLALGALIEQLAALGRHEEAQERVAAGLKLHPDAAPFHALSGRAIRAAGGDAAKARAGFERALALEPELALALVGLAEQAVLAGSTEEAIALYDRASASEPDDPAPAHAAARLLSGPEHFDERERRLAEMLTSNPRDALAAHALAVSLAERGGDLDRALGYAKRAAYFTAVPEAKETLGWVQLLRGEHASAVETLQAVVGERPEASSARYRLALALAASGDPARARTEFEAVIAGDGAKSEQARQEIARLPEAAAKAPGVGQSSP